MKNSGWNKVQDHSQRFNYSQVFSPMTKSTMEADRENAQPIMGKVVLVNILNTEEVLELSVMCQRAGSYRKRYSRHTF